MRLYCAIVHPLGIAHSHITPIYHTKGRTMSAHNILKAIAGAILERTNERTLSAQSKKESAQYPHIAQNTVNFDIELIRSWLYKIGEPEQDHFLVLDKCKIDPEALQ